MSYVIGSIVAALVGLAAWIYKLITDKKDLESKLIISNVDKALKEWDDKVRATETRVKEDERNYEDAKKGFFDKYGNGPTDPDSAS